jgi:ubiquinone/menaquinone biosynthesis C-methylase UbiE
VADDYEAKTRYRGAVAATYRQVGMQSRQWRREFEALERFLDGVAPGERILDLPFGVGRFAELYHRKEAQVVGIDMTAEMLAKSRQTAAALGLGHVQFREGLAEALPVEDAWADVVISNGVINLCADKQAVFAEILRVLRPGGRLAIADIVTATQLPVGVTCDAALWAACIGGAMQRGDYREAIEAAGFEIDDLVENDQYHFVSERADNATKKYGVKSVSILARKTV